MMEDENNPSTDDKLSIGHLLRERRESLGLSIDDVVDKIKLARRQIVALEENDFMALPETAFLRGFVRSYARLLQMDERTLLSVLPDAQVTQVRTEPLQTETLFPTEKTKNRQNVNLLLAALVIVLVIMGFVFWQARVPHHAAKVVQPDASLVTMPLTLPEPVVESSGVPETPESGASGELPKSDVSAQMVPAALPAIKPVVAASGAVLRLVFDKECWAEIKDKFGKTLSRQVNPAGTELNLEGEAPFTLVIGHAATVHLYYQGKPVDLDSYVNAGSDVARLTLE